MFATNTAYLTKHIKVAEMRGVTSGAKKAISEEINSEDSSGDIRASLVKALDLMDRCFRATALGLILRPYVQHMLCRVASRWYTLVDETKTSSF